jgi:hypothetical protein
MKTTVATMYGFLSDALINHIEDHSSISRPFSSQARPVTSADQAVMQVIDQLLGTRFAVVRRVVTNSLHHPCRNRRGRLARRRKRLFCSDLSKIKRIASPGSGLLADSDAVVFSPSWRVFRRDAVRA